MKTCIQISALRDSDLPVFLFVENLRSYSFNHLTSFDRVKTSA